jgi:hypothetical protein
VKGVQAEILLIHLNTVHFIKEPRPKRGAVKILGRQRVYPAFPKHAMNEYGIDEAAMVGRGHKASFDLWLFTEAQDFGAHPNQRWNGARDLDEVVQKITGALRLLSLVFQVVFGTQ